MPDGPAASSVLNAADRTSGPVICSYMTGWGSQGRESEETIVDRSTDLASRCFSFSITWCRSLLLSFSTCYLVILGLEGAINCILARTSHQRTTSKKRTKALLPKRPLFRGSTVATDTRQTQQMCLIVNKSETTSSTWTVLVWQNLEFL